MALTPNQVPSHAHTMPGSSNFAGDTSPEGNFPGVAAGVNLYAPSADVAMNGAIIQSTGSGQPHDNVMPSLCINFIIALFGIYPSRA